MSGVSATETFRVLPIPDCEADAAIPSNGWQRMWSARPAGLDKGVEVGGENLPASAASCGVTGGGEFPGADRSTQRLDVASNGLRGLPETQTPLDCRHGTPLVGLCWAPAIPVGPCSLLYAVTTVAGLYPRPNYRLHGLIGSTAWVFRSPVTGR